MSTTKIKLWGQCPSIRLKKADMERANLSVGDNLEIKILNNSIILKRKAPKNLDELFDNKTQKYNYDEISWGCAQGDEVW